MKFKLKSKEIRIEEREQIKKTKITARSIWHKVFIILPRRVSDTEFQFLTYVGRRLHTLGKSTEWYRNTFFREYKYKDLQQIITDKLMGKE